MILMDTLVVQPLASTVMPDLMVKADATAVYPVAAILIGLVLVCIPVLMTSGIAAFVRDTIAQHKTTSNAKI